MIGYSCPMDVDQLRCFLSVVELGSFSAAAARHFVTQPAISLRVKALEREVGARLLERSGRTVRLTPAGRLFEPRCRDILRTLDRGLADVGELSGLLRGRLAVGAIDAAGIDLLPGLLKRFHEAWPAIELVVRVEPSGPLAAALLDGTLDLAIVTMPVDRPGLAVQPLEEETLRLVAPPGRPARSAALLLRAEPLIAYPRGSVTRSLIDEALARRGLAPRIAMELSHPEAIRGLVTAGLGAAVLPERVIARGGQSLPIVPGLVVRRGLGLVRRGGEEPSAAARAFLDLAGRPVAPARPILPA